MAGRGWSKGGNFSTLRKVQCGVSVRVSTRWSNSVMNKNSRMEQIKAVIQQDCSWTRDATTV